MTQRLDYSAIVPDGMKALDSAIKCNTWGFRVGFDLLPGNSASVS